MGEKRVCVCVGGGGGKGERLVSAGVEFILFILSLQNLEMKVQSSRRLAKRKEIFIDLLHKIKVQYCILN